VILIRPLIFLFQRVHKHFGAHVTRWLFTQVPQTNFFEVDYFIVSIVRPEEGGKSGKKKGNSQKKKKKKFFWMGWGKEETRACIQHINAFVITKNSVSYQHMWKTNGVKLRFMIFFIKFFFS